jgi:probable F420-dependent oxidoreductase
VITQRDPIVTAKTVASLDLVSGGRVLFGVGAGWNLEEMRNHGTDPARRLGLMRERVEAMKAIWTQDEASYHGEHVDFDRIWSWPKPVQQPHPPVFVAGNGAKVLDRVLAFGDAWLPNPEREDDVLLGRIAELQRRADDAGRRIPVTLNAATTNAARLARFVEAGVERAVFFLPSGGWDVIERRLEQIDAARAALV